MVLERTTHSPAETKRMGRSFGKYLKGGDVVALQGELGSGKTTFVKGIARGLGLPAEKKVSSPTYVLIHEYPARKKVYHLDWYRIKKVRGLDAELARECFFSDGVTLIEWPERGKDILPSGALRVGIAHGGPTRRRFFFSFPGNADPRLMKALKRK